jgi:hypothetical protein
MLMEWLIMDLSVVFCRSVTMNRLTILDPARIRIAYAAVFILSLFCCGSSFAVVEISGLIYSDSAWSSADTIVVVGNVTVDSSVTLSIEAGSVVLFRAYCALKVYGELNAFGTIGQRIVFTDESNGQGAYWSGLQPKADGLVRLEYCDINGAIHCLQVNDASAALYGCRITNFISIGVYSSGNSLSPDDSVRLRRCEFYQTEPDLEGEGTGVYAYSVQSVEIDSCSIGGVQTGVIFHGCKFGAPDFSVTSSEVFDCSGVGILVTAYG